MVCICGVHLQTCTVPRCYYTSCLLVLPPEQNQLVSQCAGADMHTENFITYINGEACTVNTSKSGLAPRSLGTRLLTH